MEDIKIGGYTLAELKKLQTTIQKDASKVIAGCVSIGEGLVTQMLELVENNGGEPDNNVIRKLAVQAAENFEMAKLISGISGVEYFVQYQEEYLDYENVLSEKLDEIFDYEYPDGVEELMSVLSDMEHQSYLWNSSSIGC